MSKAIWQVQRLRYPGGETYMRLSKVAVPLFGAVIDSTITVTVESDTDLPLLALGCAAAWAGRCAVKANDPYPDGPIEVARKEVPDGG